MKTVIGAACAAAAVLAAAEARAQAPETCPGGYQIVRTSIVKPGQMTTFLKAARDQQAWYAAKNLPDRILVGRVLERQTAAPPTSDKTVMTVHTGMTDLRSAPHDAGDAGWNGFVAEYRQSADMVDERFVCMSPAG